MYERVTTSRFEIRVQTGGSCRDSAVYFLLIVFGQLAQSLAMQRLEQTRAAKWEVQTDPQTDELQSTNFPVEVRVLDIPSSKTNIVYATNVTTITTLSASPALKRIRVDCSWKFWNRRVFTNTIVTYRAPDQ